MGMQNGYFFNDSEQTNSGKQDFYSKFMGQKGPAHGLSYWWLIIYWYIENAQYGIKRAAIYDNMLVAQKAEALLVKQGTILNRLSKCMAESIQLGEKNKQIIAQSNSLRSKVARQLNQAYYKMTIRSTYSGNESWIALQATSKDQVIQKANFYCSYADNIFYPLEELVIEITEEKYDRFLNKKFYLIR